MIFTKQDYYDIRAMIKEIEQIEEHLEIMRMKMECASSPQLGMACHSNNVDTIGEAVANLETLQRRYYAIIGKLAEEQAKREKEIKDMPVKYRMLMRDRYVFGFKWDNIAEKNMYDKRYMFRLHREALRYKIDH